ncbi:unnamed protein product [Tilletia controversa]|uniref:Uncharacterized protein n=2 Tax=Tilletia TaxID=13289 RepID=A0A177VH62_9BASI|nr:hypothetical protein CF336_g2137 [Tilletia laevis]KAE8264455.1 hypothetical protein A4X03_0g934 [Tilletia caries]CAD6900942.1 unnamed protein product [Tilletia controversa]CAD6892309.1 unnamed protein product [Tilletia caries]CAD6896409.1 unnamed protein product [Tilletia caries]
MSGEATVPTSRPTSAIFACLRSLTIPLCLRPGFDALEFEEGGADDEATRSWIRSTVPATLTQLRELLDQQAGESSSSSSSSSSDDGIEEKSAIVACVARFWTPGLRCFDEEGEGEGEGEPQSVLRSDEDVEARAGLDSWTTADNIAQARAVLDNPFLNRNGDSLKIALYLLQHYIRPLFSLATSTNPQLDPDTGRARRADPLLTSVPATSGTSEVDAALWRGRAGHAGSNDGLELLGCPLEFESDERQDCMRRRNAALGCWNVLGWCLIQLGTRRQQRGSAPSSTSGPGIDLSPSATGTASSKASTAWEQHWHLVLPPLLTLLEDSDPHFRLLGTRLLLTAVLDPRSRDGEGVPPSLLIRTNVVPLLMGALETSFTFITSGRGHVLLDAALGAARKIVLLTTAPIQRSSLLSTAGMQGDGEEAKAKEKKAQGHGQGWIEEDGGRARAEELSALLMDGIFKIWSFPVRSASAASPGTKPSQRHELIRVTFRWLGLIVLDPNSNIDEGGDGGTTQALTLASARFLGVVCEFVGSWIEREWAGSWALYAPSPQTKVVSVEIADDLGLDEERQEGAASLLRSAEAVFAGTIALLRACASASASGGIGAARRGERSGSKGGVELDIPPGIATWGGRVLLATARIWTLLHDAGLIQEVRRKREGPIAREAAEVRRVLKMVWTVYEEVEPGVVGQHRARLLKLDADVFKDLCQ